MQRHLRMLATAPIATVLTIPAMVACGSSKATTGSTAPTSAATSAAAQPSSADSSASTAPSSGGGGGIAVALPADACKLFSAQEASTLVGATVHQFASTSIQNLRGCSWNGDNGTGDHPVSLHITSYKDVATATLTVQAAEHTASLINAPSQKPNVGDEAIVFKLPGGQDALTGGYVRKGSIVINLVAPGTTSLGAVGTAITTVTGRL